MHTCLTHPRVCRQCVHATELTPFRLTLPLFLCATRMHLTRYWTLCTALVLPVLLRGVGMSACGCPALQGPCWHALLLFYYDWGQNVLLEQWLTFGCYYVCVCMYLQVVSLLVPGAVTSPARAWLGWCAAWHDLLHRSVETLQVHRGSVPGTLLGLS